MVGATFNTRGMQNVGLAFIMEPGLRALYAGDPSALKRARGRYLKHYNTHPYWTPLLVGIFPVHGTQNRFGHARLPTFSRSSVPPRCIPFPHSGDSFFGGSFLVLWSLVGVNLAAAGKYRTARFLGASSALRPCSSSKCSPSGAGMPRGFRSCSASSPGGSSTGASGSSWSTACWSPSSCCRSRPRAVLWTLRPGPAWRLSLAVCGVLRSRDRALILAASGAGRSGRPLGEDYPFCILVGDAYG